MKGEQALTGFLLSAGNFPYSGYPLMSGKTCCGERDENRGIFQPSKLAGTLKSCKKN